MNTYLGSNFVIDIPTYIKYDGNSEAPISLFVRGDQESSVSSITLGFMFNKIFEKSFALINETHPSHETLSMHVADMRNKRPNEYDELCNRFIDISGGIAVQARQNMDQHEKLWFIEDTQECAIEDSASGYRALVNILYVLLNKPSGIVAIDEPEIHFHPMMVSRLHKELRKISKLQCNQIIIATHSSKFVTYEQVEQRHETRLIMMTRPKTVTVIHANADPNPLGVKPHLFNPEIFFGKCTMLVEGPSDFFTMKAISDTYGGLFEKYGIVLMHSDGKGNLPAFADMHEKFHMPYHGMADNDYDGKTTNITKLSGDLESELVDMGVRKTQSKAKDDVYVEVKNYFNSAGDKTWKQSGIGIAFRAVVDKAGGSIQN